MNIVTIDFDVMMHRSLPLYNDLVDDEDMSIQEVMDEAPDSQFIPNIDLYLYKYLTQYIMKCKKASIKFINGHNEMVKIIDNEVEEPFTLYNVDFHHDIAYDEYDVSNTVEDVDCGNWVKHLFEKYGPKFLRYNWIRPKESTSYKEYSPFSRKIEEHMLDRFDFHGLSKNTDILVLCKSESWVPHEQLELFKIWELLFAQK